ncbi:MAG TPA: hypothetical protein VHX61_13265 [Rhizomicrobium sp.]|jgi:hypothetical protein|nr:hypothetical protein [Rhizomicrobium sp.]
MYATTRAIRPTWLLAGCSLVAIVSSANPADAKAAPFLKPNSLVISSSTYDNTQGAVADLQAGDSLPSASIAATCQPFSTAVAGNDYVNVWNNVLADPSFGVTSAITLTDVDARTGSTISTLSIPSDQVVTSFSSKSELGLHVENAWYGPVLSFVGYGGAGVGALDASNADAVDGQDPTNPVTCFFGDTYAFPRTIVSVGADGGVAYTPTIAYGGDNGRSAFYSPDADTYYAVGNSNNGDTSSYGQGITNPDVTETTGLEVVNPLDWPTFNYGTIPSGNSAQVDPMYASVAGQKAGKDSNFRGLTEYNGALYFTKGSGSNGIDTVYTVTPGLPSLGDAGSASVSIVPGFPTDSAKSTGGDYTPFAVFFANATTMYVSDEGAGDTTDQSTHAGLEKWSLVNGTWQLDYVLTNNLIGTTYTLNGYDGAWPTVTTVGLRNLTGDVKGNRVKLWATTSTNSAAGDPGADPNEVVEITDKLSDTTLPTKEAFAVVSAPNYGSVYRGVAYVSSGQ